MIRKPQISGNKKKYKTEGKLIADFVIREDYGKKNSSEKARSKHTRKDPIYHEERC